MEAGTKVFMVNAWEEILQEKEVPKSASSLSAGPHIFFWCEETKAMIWRKLSWETAKAKLDKRENSSWELQDWETTKIPFQPFSTKNDNLVKSDIRLAQCYIATVWANSLVGVAVGLKKGQQKRKKY